MRGGIRPSFAVYGLQLRAFSNGLTKTPAIVEICPRGDD